MFVTVRPHPYISRATAVERLRIALANPSPSSPLTSRDGFKLHKVAYSLNYLSVLFHTRESMATAAPSALFLNIAKTRRFSFSPSTRLFSKDTNSTLSQHPVSAPVPGLFRHKHLPGLSLQVAPILSLICHATDRSSKNKQLQ